MATTKRADRKVESKPEHQPGRPSKRVPVSGSRDILTVDNKDPDYHYRWVVAGENENGIRLQKFIRGGYEFVSADDVEVGDDSVYKSSNVGSIVRIPSGDGMYSYLMRIKREWYEEDRANSQKKIDDVEKSIYRTRNQEEDDGQYGSIKGKSDFLLR